MLLISHHCATDQSAWRYKSAIVVPDDVGLEFGGDDGGLGPACRMGLFALITPGDVNDAVMSQEGLEPNTLHSARIFLSIHASRCLTLGHSCQPSP